MPLPHQLLLDLTQDGVSIHAFGPDMGYTPAQIKYTMRLVCNLLDKVYEMHDSGAVKLMLAPFNEPIPSPPPAT